MRSLGWIGTARASGGHNCAAGPGWLGARGSGSPVAVAAVLKESNLGLEAVF